VAEPLDTTVTEADMASTVVVGLTVLGSTPTSLATAVVLMVGAARVPVLDALLKVRSTVKDVLVCCSARRSRLDEIISMTKQTPTNAEHTSI
jgi:hypothetical protein